ncbi:DNA cytosine methyltransferase [Malacoplasma iowae]|uniref:DNA cytosine methyltransferase n=1 Tax=Malacoplasma iowae TaxID=2116 RepID=UPI003872B74F|nr:DNA cytosine methyltransferase [Malacoplasma iowae]
MNKKIFSYISLFSSGGVGCYGFKKEGFECIATVEIIKRRLDVQKFNNKCRYNTGYINDDITKEETKQKILSEIKMWKEKHNVSNVDVLIATPPCQGMSTANSKKNEKDIVRNSLVVDSVNLVNNILPNIFVFENVPAFMKTDCISCGKSYKIEEYIYKKLSANYSIYHNVIDFKDYGVPSHRKRCIVIGVKKNISFYVSPLELFPDYVENKNTIRKTISDLPSLKNMGDIYENDIYHFFRPYDIRMREWIKYIKEGQSAFENLEIEKRPHKIVNGKIILNKNNMGGKYKRLKWDEIAKCIHTRNDQLASQNTIHPSDDRVFSIRELMRFMTIDESFKWTDIDEKTLNKMTILEKKEFLKKNEINIRQLIGEAVPTLIFSSIAKKIKFFLSESNYKFHNDNKLLEIKNTSRNLNGAFFTDKFLVNEIVKCLPSFDDKNEINILEPSVGFGSFIPLIIKKYENKKINLDLCDIDKKSLIILKKNLNKLNYDKNNIYINGDFLKYNFKKKYDLVLGNPPFININKEQKKNFNLDFKNGIISYFIFKALEISKFVSFVLPKNFLIIPKYNNIRDYLKKFQILNILDFESDGFCDVTMETISILVSDKLVKNNEIIIKKISSMEQWLKDKNYICDDLFPNWIIYRNSFFDNVLNTLKLGIFNVFRDRQITNKFLKLEHKNSRLWVLRSRNLDDNGNLINIENYDKYIEKEIANNFVSSKYIESNDVYICPNFTYKIRVAKKPINTMVNGSLALLIKSKEISISENDINYFSSNEFHMFYQISNNFQKNTLNIDSNSVHFFGIKKYN